MNQPLTLGDLSRPEWDQFQAALDRFEEAWDGTNDVDLVPFLPPWGDRLRLVYLFEFIKTDLEMRWRRSQRPRIEDYLKRFPELKSRPAEFPKLLAEEYRARQTAGEDAPTGDYQQRFPEHFAEFCRLLGTATKTGSGTLRPVEPATPAPASATPPLKATADPGAATIATPAPPAAPAARPPWTDGVLAVGGGYKLIRRLGAGQFGEVWLSEAPGGVEVALKIIRRGLAQAEAQRELQALEATKRLRHSYLLQIQAYWSLEDRLIIAMELADGTLTDEMKKHEDRCIPMPDLLRFMKESAEVLDFLHDQQVVHRDIKPENILLLRGHVKVADLGLARLMLGHSFTGTTAGSPAYMAPEVWQGRATRFSDQYSLAASYVQLRLKHSLFPGTDMYGVMLAHLREEPDLSELAQPERKVVLRALAKNPKQRFATCTEFVHALNQALTQPDEPKPTAAASGRRWAAWGIVLTSLLGVALVVAAIFWPTDVPTPTQPTQATQATPPTPHERPLLPDGYEAAEGAVRETINGQDYYSHIVCKGLGLPSDKTRQATFILITPPPDSEVKAPFYIMQHKVSNRFFQAVLDARRGKLTNGWPGEEWKKGAKSLDAAGRDLGIDGDQFDFPVFRIQANDAEQFAALIGGRLPTSVEWGVAAGFSPNDPSETRGPFVGQIDQWKPKEFALKDDMDRTGGAMPVGIATRDRHLIDRQSDKKLNYCYDMASNGYEWSATSVNGDGSLASLRVDFNIRGNPLLQLMSTTYTFTEPMKYNYLTLPNAGKGRGDTNKPDQETEISFRIVVDTNWQ